MRRISCFAITLVGLCLVLGATAAPSSTLQRLFEQRLDLDSDGHVSQLELDAFYVASGTSHHANDEVRALLSDTQVKVVPSHVHAEHGDTREGMTWTQFRAQFARLDFVAHPTHPREV